MGNGPAGSTKYREFLDEGGNYQLLKEDSTTRKYSLYVFNEKMHGRINIKFVHASTQ